MSWNEYIARFLATEQVGDAAIFGHDGTLWAGNTTSGHLHNTPAATIKSLQSSDLSGLLQNGVSIGKRKYTVVSSGDSKSVYLKSKSSTPDDPKCSALVRIIANTIVILEGKHPQVTIQQLISATIWMADHLEGSK